jgi:hypothetical protein
MGLSQTMVRLQELQPETTAELCNITRLAPEATDAQLLELCAGYIDAALLLQVWTPPHALTEKEQAYIAFTEQFVSSVGTMSEAQVARLQQFASADEVYTFVNALYVTDMHRRLEIVAGRMLA